MSSSSSSEAYPKHFQHDVFLSFRGEDTRRGFTSHLHTALTSSSIITFMDDTGLERGAEIHGELLAAIEASKIAIVVFSPRYGGSRWCLHELVKIMDCHKTFGLLVIPIFYHVDPTHVRFQKGAFGNEYRRLIQRHTEAHWFPGFTRALTDAANLSGWHITQDMYESEVIKRIVGDLLRKLDNATLPITDYPVGLKSRAHDVIQHLKGKSNTVCNVLGIWGMGGSGKSTLAKVIYNQIHREFVYTSFLADIREAWDTNRGQIDLQQQLLSNILKLKKTKIHSIEWGKAMIKKTLCGTRALLVLDDVNRDEQLQALCGSRAWICPGSVVIITTRDVRVLNVLKPDHVIRMKEMDESESLELFSWHAFKQESPKADFNELSRNVVAYCGGLPLALEVLGSYLYKRTNQEWESVLSKLQMIPNDRVQEKLRISFDGLRDHMEKDIFLDICCFFIGKNIAYVTEILDGCGLHAKIGISALLERSLIKVEKKNKLGMHDLLRDMGREIVREKSPEELEKRSRLWSHEDVIDVLTEHTGTKTIEGLALKLQKSSRVYFSTKAFEKMKRLRLLQLDQVQLDGDYGYIPKHLKWVYWRGFPLKYTPENLCLGNLVAMDLRHSNLKLVWKEPQVMERLKILNLSHSRYLTNTPDFSKLPKLEKLILKDCPSLSEVHESIGYLSSLLLINLKDCTSIRNFPRTFYKLQSLETLIISGCSKIDKLDEDIVQMESMRTLIAKNTAIRQVPFSIVKLKSIGYISLCEYEGSTCDVFPSLIWSWMSPALNSLSCIHSFGGMSSSLVSINIDRKNEGDLSSMLSSLSKLRSVWVQCGSEIQLTQDFRRILDGLSNINAIELTASQALQISKHALRSVMIGMGSYHQVFNTLSSSISQGFSASESGDIFLPGDKCPCWLSYTGEGNSVIFEVPQFFDGHPKGMILCVVYSSTPENMADECLIGVLMVNHTKCFIQLYKRDTLSSLNDEEWQDIVSNLEPHDKVEFFVVFGHSRLTVKKTALYLICDELIDEIMEPSPEPMTPITMSSKPDQTEPTTQDIMLSKPDQTELLSKPDQIEPMTLDKMLAKADQTKPMALDKMLSEPDQTELLSKPDKIEPMKLDKMLSKADQTEPMTLVSTLLNPDQTEPMTIDKMLSKPDQTELLSKPDKIEPMKLDKMLSKADQTEPIALVTTLSKLDQTEPMTLVTTQSNSDQLANRKNFWFKCCCFGQTE
ncbi:hypothetical protein RIF29_31309 [Crotalaria pallida]|uniref:ADP-ribosyl cyclase/cyclic ADP-ribose hydrolase n=1 Tax=Crotalaria pallida TaxID=3830 RepID=A0AAN9EJ89_CROPI